MMNESRATPRTGRGVTVPDSPARRWRGRLRAWPVLDGVLPVRRSRVPAEVLAGQLPGMLGVTAAGGQAIPKLAHTVRALPHVRWADVALSAGVIAVVLLARRASRRLPGLLIAVIIAIIVS